MQLLAKITGVLVLVVGLYGCITGSWMGLLNIFLGYSLYVQTLADSEIK